MSIVGLEFGLVICKEVDCVAGKEGFSLLSVESNCEEWVVSKLLEE